MSLEADVDGEPDAVARITAVFSTSQPIYGWPVQSLVAFYI